MCLLPSISEDRKLINKIESLRMEMITIGLKEGLGSNNTIAISQKLDKYIEKYQNISLVKS